MTHRKLLILLFNLERDEIEPFQSFQCLMVCVFGYLSPFQVDILEGIDIVAHVVVVGFLSNLASPQQRVLPQFIQVSKLGFIELLISQIHGLFKCYFESFFPVNFLNIDNFFKELKSKRKPEESEQLHSIKINEEKTIDSKSKEILPSSLESSPKSIFDFTSIEEKNRFCVQKAVSSIQRQSIQCYEQRETTWIHISIPSKLLTSQWDCLQ